MGNSGSGGSGSGGLRIDTGDEFPDPTDNNNSTSNDPYSSGNTGGSSGGAYPQLSCVEKGLEAELVVSKVQDLIQS